MKKETKHKITNVLIEEFYSKENGEVFWNWRFQNGEWNKQLTAFKELPWIEVNFTNLQK
ncbi:MAG TPA: hypothetical protein VMV95_01280 [Bacillota bacterium]|nr:hypothetical protein [Bacillota bacterium]